MSASECYHRESWTVQVRKTEGDEWPALKPFSASKVEFTPETVSIHIDRSPEHKVSMTVTVSGPRIRKDGSEARVLSSRRFYHDDSFPGGHWPPWLVTLTDAERRRYGLTEQVLAVRDA